MNPLAQLSNNAKFREQNSFHSRFADYGLGNGMNASTNSGVIGSLSHFK